MSSRSNVLSIMVGATAMILANTVDASSERTLKHNPFSRPPSERTIPDIDRVAWSEGVVQALDLRATLVGTRDRLANVGGRILRPGDEVQGYTLVRVYEDRAVFSRQGNHEVIYVKPDPVESDE